MTIDKSFIEKILSLAPANFAEINGRTFTDRQLAAIDDPVAVPISCHTITGLVDYLDTMDAGEQEEAVFHIVDFDRVSIVSPIFGSNKQRETYITANAYELKHRLNSHMPVDEFIIYLQSMFVQDDVTAKIMKVVGNLSQGQNTTHADDGVTQRVEAKVGVTRVEVVDLPNPVELRPFRTFMDIEQPQSKFILRIKADDSGPQCALYEADGGAWKNKAIANIKDYLKGRDIVQIIAKPRVGQLKQKYPSRCYDHRDGQPLNPTSTIRKDYKMSVKNTTECFEVQLIKEEIARLENMKLKNMHEQLKLKCLRVELAAAMLSYPSSLDEQPKPDEVPPSRLRLHFKEVIKDMDFTGCNEIIADNLRQGRIIQCYLSCKPGPQFVIGYSNCRYIFLEPEATRIPATTQHRSSLTDLQHASNLCPKSSSGMRTTVSRSTPMVIL